MTLNSTALATPYVIELGALGMGYYNGESTVAISKEMGYTVIVMSAIVAITAIIAMGHCCTKLCTKSVTPIINISAKKQPEQKQPGWQKQAQNIQVVSSIIITLYYIIKALKGGK